VSTQQTDLVVLKSAVVSVSPERAFEVFTKDMATWWPIDTHSIGAMDDKDGPPEAVVFETGPSGRIYERTADGEERHWANVLTWEPPRLLVIEWKLTVAPTEVEVRFTPEGDGTRVELEHRGFERLGAEAEESHERYSNGWPKVFQDYVETVGK
jgi:uncharacterized protein YndB with AHSA1/START domain